MAEQVIFRLSLMIASRRRSESTTGGAVDCAVAASG